MGIGEAIIIASIVGAGTAVVVSEENRKAASKASSKQRKQQAKLAALNRDRKAITPKDISKRNARTALVTGSPRGILTEDSLATSGRGTLLGN